MIETARVLQNLVAMQDEEIKRLKEENERLRALIADLTYNDIDRGYTRWSQMWADAVRVSARNCGLSEEDINVLTAD